MRNLSSAGIIGIALGAQRADVFRLVLRQGLTFTLIGVALGDLHLRRVAAEGPCFTRASAFTVPRIRERDCFPDR